MSDGSSTHAKPVQMATMIPATEEPIIAVQVIGCKSGQIYVGHAPGQEQAAHNLLLGGIGTLHAAVSNKLAEHEASRIIPANGAMLAGLMGGKRDS